MNGLVIILIAAVVLICCYVFYGRYLAKKWGIDVASILGNVYICASMFYGSHITDRGPCCSGRGSFLLCNKGAL